MVQLKIPKKLRTRGLYVYCNKCKSKSTSQLLSHSACSHPAERQVFRIILYIPGKTGVRIKTLPTRNVEEAVEQTVNYLKELKENNFQRIEKKSVQNSNPQDLVGSIAMYKDFMKNENVYKFQMKRRSQDHIDQVLKYLDRFMDSLIEKKIKVSGLLLKDVNNFHVNVFYEYLENKNIANVTFNRHLDIVKDFFNYLIQVMHYSLTNYFSNKIVIRKSVTPNNESISNEEFKELLNVIKPETNIEYLSTGAKKYHYFDWLSDAFELALYTGLRRDSIVNLKFSDVYERNGLPVFIKTEDYKYNRRITNGKKKYLYVPVIKDLYEFLKRVGYDEHKGKDRYIIAPDNLAKRSTIKIEMTRGFSHYYDQLYTSKKLTFKHLRKTYITKLNNFTNFKAEVITGHSGQPIIKESYHDPKIFNDVLKDFQMGD